MVYIFKWCFSRVLTPAKRLMVLFACSYHIQGFSANSSIPDISLLASQKTFLLLALSLLLIFLLVRYRRNRYGLSCLPGKQYAYLEISKSKQQIGLYRRHQTNTDTVLNISDVISSKIMLNDKLVNLITQEQADTFTAEQEKQLQANFARIQSEKMLDGQLRKVHLVLTDKQHKRYAICLYLRSGNKRLTHTRYRDVVEDILDWCRLLSSQINRYHCQEAQTPSAGKNSPPQQEISPAQQQKEKSPQEQESRQHNSNSEFLASLEKLAKLRQQGLLSESEFVLAKKKLLAPAEDKLN
ncbi:SHOCT domain-containing protein [Thalassomonas actiniarum]|uniref:SHOCT domain-containing protein n=1 Tax=Thalassomonas actiniarum TaxID=485447 RepID=A0AAE9YRM0_9GAMM|nr:SHOCT domain-containing protein [Thalassomonas actiniarum]WDD99447.1 SHOCT domain-containing protein [Thalassomonas actiniarum]